MLVHGYGPKNAKIVLCGEAPGATEEQTGVPFTGSSGWLLDKMLIHTGIPRNECYITNVVKERPPKNNFGFLYLDKGRTEPSPTLVKARGELLKEIRSISPNVIIPLGNEALKAITGKRSIEHWRGSIIQTELGKVIPTYHPAFILRTYEKRAIAELDLRKARKESITKEYKKIEYNFKINPSFTEVIAFLKTKHKLLSFDIETIGQHTRCLGFAWNETDGICIPFIKNSNTNYWSIEEELEILKRLNILFMDKTIGKVAQNFPFDSTILAKDFGFDINGLVMDTMIAQHTCYCELPKSLEFLTSIYTNIPYYKSYNVKDDVSTWTYNLWDCVATFQVAEILEKELKELKVYDFYKSHCHPLMLALTLAGNRGVLIDKELRKKEKALSEARKVEIGLKLVEATGMNVNPDSPKQMKELLYDKLKMKPIIHRKTHAKTTDGTAIMTLRAKYPVYRNILDLILAHRGETKLLGTFLKSELNSSNRLPTTYNAAGTVTGRINSKKTIFGLGGDLQQVPRGEFRRMFIAPKGKVLVKGDLSQAEARVTIWCAKNEGLISKYLEKDFDIHIWAASLFRNKPMKQITKEERQEDKGIVHGIHYGRGARSISIANGITLNEAKQRMLLYFGAFPQLRLWHQEIRDKVTKDRMLKTPFGRIRIFMKRINEETFRSAFAFIPQSIVGDIINKAFFILTETLPKKCYLVLQVHDELVVECLEEKKDECIKLIKEACEQDIIIPPITTPLRIPVKISVGYNWYKME